VDLPLDGLGAGEGASPPSDGPTDDSKGSPSDETSGPLEFLQGVELTPQFADLPLEASNDGRLLSLAGAGTQGLSIAGKLAVLQTIEFHLPAEHRLGGTPVDLELVLWLKHPEKGRLALSLLFRKGQANGAIERLVERLPLEGTYERKLLNAAMPLPDLVAGGGSLLTYLGSESTPPCQASIPRLVLAQVGELSSEQLGRLTDALPVLSGRPVQPLGDRKVQVLTLTSTPLSSSSENKP
jgi:carbonic anhydrase